MTPKEFKKLCQKYNVKVSDLPAFPPKDMSDKKWEKFIKFIGNKNDYYVAYYQPGGHPSWTKLFKTEKEAEEYAISKNCWICRKMGDGIGSMCASEWLIVPYNKYLKAKGHGDLMKAAGWKRIK